ncbi:Dihydrofolate reductase [Siphonobacter aquaeclarae]|uniref:Dihydrofolate reductase n=2 Tax=Siphonobacter aquaeclarae TaxID=563176 RepID=A0A1G9IAU1_9BACT|nr:Dihydrofolate reductase [Siphonobacter aquaeclarae]
MMTTLDGYFQGPHGELPFHGGDAESDEFAVQQQDDANTLLFGRRTYEMMAAYWPTSMAAANSPELAATMNRSAKIVFSDTLPEASWENTLLIRGSAAEAIRALKQQPGGNLVILGSSALTASLLNEGLVDTLDMMVHPILLGSGNPVFEKVTGLPLRLIHSRPFRSGKILLTYEPK